MNLGVGEATTPLVRSIKMGLKEEENWYVRAVDSYPRRVVCLVRVRSPRTSHSSTDSTSTRDSNEEV